MICLGWPYPNSIKTFYHRVLFIGHGRRWNTITTKGREEAPGRAPIAANMSCVEVHKDWDVSISCTYTCSSSCCASPSLASIGYSRYIFKHFDELVPTTNVLWELLNLGIGRLLEDDLNGMLQ